MKRKTVGILMKHRYISNKTPLHFTTEHHCYSLVIKYINYSEDINIFV